MRSSRCHFRACGEADGRIPGLTRAEKKQATSCALQSRGWERQDSRLGLMLVSTQEKAMGIERGICWVSVRKGRGCCRLSVGCVQKFLIWSYSCGSREVVKLMQPVGELQVAVKHEHRPVRSKAWTLERLQLTEPWGEGEGEVDQLSQKYI